MQDTPDQLIHIKETLYVNMTILYGRDQKAEAQVS